MAGFRAAYTPYSAFATAPNGPDLRASAPRAVRRVRRALVAALLLPLSVAAAQDAAAPGDLSIDHMAVQEAGMNTCAYGYWAEKSGDHATANAIFDRCIEAGYAGAMIWKALLYEEGNGVPQNSARAAALLKRAAESGDSGYATLGKLHYATALHLGKGVPRDEAEAMKWFRAAAEEGSEEAREFLLTGHHTADRDLQARGVGEQAPRVQGQRLARAASPSEAAPTASLGPWLLAAALGVAFVAGLMVQASGLGRFRARRAVAEGA